jgi:Fe-S cluster assembly protein SufD
MINRIIKAGKESLIVSDASESCRITLGARARLTYVLLAKEQTQNKVRIEFDLAGEKSEVRFVGFIIGKGAKAFNIETLARHKARATKSRFSIKAALYDSSCLDFNGNIFVGKQAQLSDAHLSCNTLLLSEKAKVNTMPALEILADDVKAGHSATIGKIDGESLFYLSSRGLDDVTAGQLLIEAFFASQIKLIDDQKTRDNIQNQILKLIPSHV